ncbi:DUF4349 domain-containing protein [Fervidibacillus halotolerans]|uniref:DUF4349 domain-containing protein n=1 Tax=Fervidibacillus halotolerans TaxID=2980027 RepID=A0A9E8LXY0_9BACI|nr:DUF4349 domain-containing protein [Fervidibacillus halotolerans]WAA11727.1 DUF4349 domain-containing protein [Fervidibacillus halotolerans]
MKKQAIFAFIICFTFILFGCSHESKSEGGQVGIDSGDPSIGEEFNQRNDQEVDYDEPVEEDGAYADEVEKVPDEGNISNLNRKIIYTAYLEIEVKDYEQAFDEISRHATNNGGYVVESSMSATTNNQMKGQVTVRIPQEHFQTFLDQVKNVSNKVKKSSVQGQDVTEEYIDLESRLKSKRIVEDRLLNFMENAEKTTDLLAISKDLAEVQEEIESIIGRMNYLKNRADLATVTIFMSEKSVQISSKLNTWEQTKDQFKKSVNFLLNTFSTIIVFVIGGLPILFFVGIIGIGIYLIVKKRIKHKKGGPKEPEP